MINNSIQDRPRPMVAPDEEERQPTPPGSFYQRPTTYSRPPRRPSGIPPMLGGGGGLDEMQARLANEKLRREALRGLRDQRRQTQKDRMDARSAAMWERRAAPATQEAIPTTPSLYTVRPGVDDWEHDDVMTRFQEGSLEQRKMSLDEAQGASKMALDEAQGGLLGAQASRTKADARLAGAEARGLDAQTQYLMENGVLPGAAGTAGRAGSGSGGAIPEGELGRVLPSLDPQTAFRMLTNSGRDTSALLEGGKPAPQLLAFAGFYDQATREPVFDSIRATLGLDAANKFATETAAVKAGINRAGATPDMGPKYDPSRVQPRGAAIPEAPGAQVGRIPTGPANSRTAGEALDNRQQDAAPVQPGRIPLGPAPAKKTSTPLGSAPAGSRAVAPVLPTEPDDPRNPYLAAAETMAARGFVGVLPEVAGDLVGAGMAGARAVGTARKAGERVAGTAGALANAPATLRGQVAEGAADLAWRAQPPLVRQAGAAVSGAAGRAATAVGGVANQYFAEVERQRILASSPSAGSAMQALQRSSSAKAKEIMGDREVLNKLLNDITTPEDVQRFEEWLSSQP